MEVARMKTSGQSQIGGGAVVEVAETDEARNVHTDGSVASGNKNDCEHSEAWNISLEMSSVCRRQLMEIGGASLNSSAWFGEDDHTIGEGKGEGHFNF